MSEEQLVRDNVKLVWSVVHKYKAPYGYDQEDMFQIGCIALLRAIRKFDKAKGYKFSTFAVMVIKNEFNTLINHLQSKRRKENKLVRLDEEVEEGDPLVDFLPSKDSVEEQVLYNELERIALTKHPEVAKLTLQGYSQTDIGNMVGLTHSAIHYKVIAIRQNLRSVVNG